jgi:hypothetical protein
MIIRAGFQYRLCFSESPALRTAQANSRARRMNAAKFNE